jgi:hypothetical protein
MGLVHPNSISIHAVMDIAREKEKTVISPDKVGFEPLNFPTSRIREISKPSISDFGIISLDQARKRLRCSCVGARQTAALDESW